MRGHCKLEFVVGVVGAGRPPGNNSYQFLIVVGQEAARVLIAGEILKIHGLRPGRQLLPMVSGSSRINQLHTSYLAAPAKPSSPRGK